MVIKKFLILILIFGYFAYFTSAYSGVSPGMYVTDFKPGAEEIFTFTFNGDVDSSYEVYAEGDLAKYVTLSVDELNGGGSVSVLIEMPQSIEVPGEHSIYIGARQEGYQPGISVTSNVQGLIIVKVPYPGNYAIMSFDLENASSGEDIKMNIKINNLGTELANFVGKINIYGEKGNYLETMDLGEFQIDSTQSENIDYVFDAKPYPPGRYSAEAIFEYEGGILKDKKNFRLGELVITIIDATRKLDRDSINKFEVFIESQWNDPIQNIYAEVNVFGKGIKFTTPSIAIDGFQKGVLVGFFDTTGIEDESFNVNVRVFYEGKYTEKFVKLSFKNETNYLLIAGIAAGVIFLIIVIILIVITFKLKRIKDEIREKKRK